MPRRSFLGVPKRPASSPRTGRRSLPRWAGERPGERAELRDLLHARVARARARREHAADLLDQAREARLVGEQRLHLPARLADLGRRRARARGAARAARRGSCRGRRAAAPRSPPAGARRSSAARRSLGRLGEARAQLAQQLRGGARQLREVVQPARDARPGRPRRARRAARRARRPRSAPRACGRAPPAGARGSLPAPSGARRGARAPPRAAALGFERAQRAVGVRDRALGVAQRVARLASAAPPSRPART